ncbi:MAG: hypothetical protein DGJ47_000214 [Rickettsiaceae bacterium]
MSLVKNEKLILFLQKLFDTNEKFAQEHDDNFFEQFREEQDPQLTILKCSDSRVQMESFDKTPQNGVFAVRNIGNQICTSEGSVDFGVEVLKTPFLLIIGHSGCGAIEAVLNNSEVPSKAIKRELATLKVQQKSTQEAILENINNQVTIACAKYSDKIKNGELVILGAVYDFKDDFGFGKGRVVLTNINNITDKDAIEEVYKPSVKNLNCL